MTAPVIYWFRNDLRLDDLPGLSAALASGRPVLPIFILDDGVPGAWPLGSASRWWLHHSLASLSAELRARGAHLHLFRGNTQAVLESILADTGAVSIFCSRTIEPGNGEQESALHAALAPQGIEVRRYPGSLLFEPESIHTKSGAPFKVFTPFWRNCRAQTQPPLPRPLPEEAQFFSMQAQPAALNSLALLPVKPNWAAGWEQHWQPGREGARAALSQFLATGITNYDESRNHPARKATSRLSPHIRFGEISPRQVWHAALEHCRGNTELQNQLDKFLSELGWREFSHHLLHHFPHLPEQPFKSEFADFPWLGSESMLRAWQCGMTGYPIVDAGMRELWQTGYMHNRVRMITASFLTKHLLLPWQSGAQWFWDTLVDADLANNSCGWQWVAGSGADAAPYFRIFNPTLQGEKFDREGGYVRRWVPELSALPDKHLHEPAAAPPGVLEAAGITLGVTYPAPIVNHKEAREAALAAHASIR